MILNVVIISTVHVAVPIFPPVARSLMSIALNTVDHELCNVATGVFVPSPNLLFALSQKKLLSPETNPAVPANSIDPEEILENVGATENVFAHVNV